MDGNVRFVEFASLTDPRLVPVAVARVLGVATEPGHSVLDRLTRRFDGQHTLLLLDKHKQHSQHGL